MPSSPQHQQQATLPAGLGLPPRPTLTPARQAAQQQAQQQEQQQEQREGQPQDAALSPFARLALAEPPSLIPPPPGLLSQANGLAGARQPILQLMQPPSLLGACGASDLSSSAGSSPTASAHSRSGSISAEVALARRNSHEGWGTSTHLSEGHAAEELFYRLNHARQTVDFVKRQVSQRGPRRSEVGRAAWWC